MANVLNKVMGIFGLDDGNIDDYEEESNVNEKSFERDYEEEIDEPIINKRNSKVVNIHTNATMRVILSRPKDYDEATSICDELKNRKIVVVNVSDLEPKVAQRLLDFMGGASYVLNGELQEIEKNVYILSPSNVEVSNELKTEMTGKGMFAWTK
jgi:cell division inhibitor SepF